MEKDLVSIIMPSYNAADYITETIESVLRQTYQNWELIITDDCSSDNTEEIVIQYIFKDSRIKFNKLEHNSGAAVARNKSVELAKGRYIAFLDSDDVWLENKLSHQIEFMQNNNSTFCCTYYERMNEEGVRSGVVIKDDKIKTYNDLLKNCPGNSTIIYDASLIGKHYGLDIKKRNDYVLWLSVIKDSKRLDSFDEVTMLYRVRSGSISSKKLKLIRYHWDIYRNVEGLNPVCCVYLITYWCTKGIVRKMTKGFK